MNRKEIAHAWAHQTKPNGKASALSFDGPVFRSYATTIARILAPGVVLLNDYSFSPTTQRHQSAARQALPSAFTILHFSDGRRGTDLTPTGPEVVEYCIARAALYEVKANRARAYKAIHQQSAAQYLGYATAAALHYGCSLPDDLTARILEINALAAASEKEHRQMEREADARREADAAEKLSRWMAGEPVNLPHLSKARFRALPSDPEQIESSLGVRVPRPDFMRAVRFAIARRSKGWRANGETCPVGPYQLSAITPEGVVAGCHRVSWDEVERWHDTCPPWSVEA